jgi:hypothetical protein
LAVRGSNSRSTRSSSLAMASQDRLPIRRERPATRARQGSGAAGPWARRAWARRAWARGLGRGRLGRAALGAAGSGARPWARQAWARGLGAGTVAAQGDGLRWADSRSGALVGYSSTVAHRTAACSSAPGHICQDYPPSCKGSAPWLLSAKSAARGRDSATTSPTLTAGPRAAGTRTSKWSAPGRVGPAGDCACARPASRQAKSPAEPHWAASSAEPVPGPQLSPSPLRRAPGYSLC